MRYKLPMGIAALTLVALTGCASEGTTAFTGDRHPDSPAAVSVEDSYTGDEMLDAALQITWDNMSSDDQDLICYGNETMGSSFVGSKISEGSDGTISAADAADFVEEMC